MIAQFKSISLIAFTVLLCGASAFGQKAYTLKSHKVSVDGTSSLHDWSSAVTAPEWSGMLTVEGTTVKAVQNVVLKIPVVSIKSEKGGTMDEKTYEAFKYEKFPDITFKMTNAVITGTTAKASGTLTMAGVTKPIVMTVTMKAAPDGSVRFTGSYIINMTHYNMTPPTAVMGTIKVGEVVTFLFDMTVVPQ